MHHWKALKSAINLSDTRTSIYTPRKNSELSDSARPNSTLGSTLTFIKNQPHARLAFECLKFESPFLRKQSRFKRINGTWGYVTNLDICLLLAAGYYHREIAVYLRTTRLAITRMTKKIKTAFIVIQSSQRPLQAVGIIRVKPENDGFIKTISEILKSYQPWGYPLARYVIRQIQNLLNEETRKSTRRYERKTISVGVGKTAEEKLDDLHYNHADSGKVTQRRVRDRHQGQYDADKMLLQYWKGRLDWLKHEDKLEIALRTKHVASCLSADLPPCPSCEAWLRIDSYSRPWNNPREDVEFSENLNRIMSLDIDNNWVETGQ